MADPLFFIFTLCVVYSGGEDCSWSWEIKDIENPFHEALAIPDEKRIVSETGNPKTLGHEAKHVICFLEYPQGFERDRCNHDIHVEDFHQKATNSVDPTPVPPVTNPKHTDLWRSM
jgi:hypothetical protein